MKPIFQNGTPEEILAAQKVLFKTLDVGLRLLSPFMPFITEELYQRLPRKTLKYSSICVSPYPDENECPWRNEEIEKEVDFAQKVIKSIRSSRSTYNLPNKTKTDAYMECSDKSLETKLKKYSSLIGILAYSNVLEGKPSQGCTIITVTDKLQFHLVLKVMFNSHFPIFRFKIMKKITI